MNQHKGCRVVEATESQSMGGRIPELRLVLDEGERRGNWHSLMDRLLDSGTWHRGVSITWHSGVESNAYESLIYANDGDFHTSRLVRFDPKGSRSVQGSDGKTWKYSWFTWASLAYLPELGDMVDVLCYFKGTGNIQSGTFAKTIVEAAIQEANLPFAVVNRRVVYTGPEDVIRDADVYRNCNGLTWGIHFYRQAYHGAHRGEEWGGAHWPDEVTAKAVANRYVKAGTKQLCANLGSLREQFPGHPVIAKVVRLEAKKARA